MSQTTTDGKDALRYFTQRQRRILWVLSGGYCQICGKKIVEDEWHADHILPHAKNGLTLTLNGQVTCAKCNRKKGVRYEI